MATGNVERGERAYRYFFSLAEQYRRQVVVDDEIADEPDWPEIGRAFARELAEAADSEDERDGIMLGILAYAGVRGISDLPCFMATTAAKAFAAMSHHAVTQGDVPSFAIEVQHVWYNQLQAEREAAGMPLLTRMGQVAATLRDKAKAMVADIATGVTTLIIEGRHVFDELGLLGLLPTGAYVPDGEYEVLAARVDTNEGSLHARLSLVYSL